MKHLFLFEKEFYSKNYTNFKLYFRDFDLSSGDYVEIYNPKTKESIIYIGKGMIVDNEDSAELSKKKVDVHDFQPPLDNVDGAARVMDPLIVLINTGKHCCGKFLKDYFPIDLLVRFLCLKI